MNISGYSLKEEKFRTARTAIFNAVKNTDGKPYIIKLATEQNEHNDVAAFKIEQEVLNLFHHHCIIHLEETIEENNSFCLVLEDGGISLSEYLSKNSSPMDLSLFLTIAVQCAEALSEIHKQNVIHKDINPRNILIDLNAQRIKIIDFGISSRLNREKQHIKTFNQLEGSLPYISPEQTGRMNLDLDYRSDFYSLGLTLFELLTGKLPFFATDPIGWVHAQMSKELPDINGYRKDVPESIVYIIQKMTQKDPGARYQSAFGLMRDLQRCSDEYTSSKTISLFKPGEYDISEKFMIPQALIGREKDVQKILEVFELVQKEGKPQILFVSGLSGIGKSALINEVQKPLVQARGNFIEGKFDQFQKNVPYKAVIDAFNEMLDIITHSPEEQYQEWIKNIKDALTENGQIIVDLLPRLELLLGKQPSIQDLGAEQNKHRFYWTIKQFIQKLCTKQHPLVLFLDDLQWADAATFNLLDEILRDNDLKHLFIIGAYRNNEVDEYHPLMLLRKNIMEFNQIHEVLVASLTCEQTAQIVAGTLLQLDNKVMDVSTWIFQKTEGNPFFINELLKSIYIQEGFNLNRDSGCWEYEMSKIAALQITDNVVELMLARIQSLPELTKDILKVAACIGNRFDLKILKSICKIPNIGLTLKDALVEGFINALSGNYQKVEFGDDVVDNVEYQFQHDRVQQAAYKMLDETKQKELHLKIGRELIKKTTGEIADEAVIPIVRQINKAIDMIENVEEKIFVANLNLRAGQKAKASTSYDSALSFFQNAEILLPDNSWNLYYDLTKDIFLGIGECHFILGQFDKGEKISQQIISKVKTNYEKAETLGMQINFYAMEQKIPEAINIAHEALAYLGSPMKKNPGIFSILKEFISLKINMKGRTIKDLNNMPIMSDKQMILTMKIGADFGQIIYGYLDKKHFLYIVLYIFSKILKYGNIYTAEISYIGCAIILNGIFNKYKSSYEFGQLAWNTIEKSKESKFLLARAILHYGVMISPWNESIKISEKKCEDALLEGVKTGDKYTANLSMSMSFPSTSLSADLNRFEKQQLYLKKTKDTKHLQFFNLKIFYCVSLMGEQKNRKELDTSFIRENIIHHEGGLPDDNLYKAKYYLITLQMRYFFEDTKNLETILRDNDIYQEKFMSSYLSIVSCFFTFISLSRLFSKHTHSQKKRMRKEYKRMKRWANYKDVNTCYFQLMMEAEFCRLEGRGIEAIKKCEEAVAITIKNDLLEHTCLAQKLLANIYIDLDLMKQAQGAMSEAYRLYKKLGAEKVCEFLESKYAEYLKSTQEKPILSSSNTIVPDTTMTNYTGTSSPTASVLDINTVIKSSQVLSGEINFQKLLTKMVRMVIENAGATRGIFIINSNGKYFVQAEGFSNKEEVTTMQGFSAQSYESLSQSALQYTLRNKSSLICNNIIDDSMFSEDTYIKQSKVKSLLTTPIVNRGEMVAILYLENDSVANSFTNDRLEMLRHISSQVAISLENVQLIGNLEEKVEERTLQLKASQKNITDILTNIDEAILVIKRDCICIKDHSEKAELFFNQKDFGDQNICTLFGLNQQDTQMFSSWVPLIMTKQDPKQWNKYIKLCPCRSLKRVITVNDTPKEIYIDIDYQPILEDNSITKIMVVMKDVTSQKLAEERLAQLEEEQKNQMQRVYAMIENDRDFVVDYIESLRSMLENLSTISLNELLTNEEKRKSIYREVHTVKGNSGSVGFGSVSKLIHTLEDCLGDREKLHSIATGNLNRWNELIDPLRKELEAIDAVYKKIYSDSEADELKVSKSVYDSVAHEIQLLASSNLIVDHYQSMRYVPLKKCCKRLSNIVRQYAEKNHKEIEPLEILNGDQRISQELFSTFEGSLVHIVRNAIDHGIENDDDRGEKGPGHVKLGYQKVDNTIIVTVQDDGRGIDGNKLVRKAIEKSIITESDAAHYSNIEKINLIFHSGFSTKESVSETSGRGVGMDAVKHEIESMGGTIDIETIVGKGTTFKLNIPIILS